MRNRNWNKLTALLLACMMLFATACGDKKAKNTDAADVAAALAAAGGATYGPALQVDVNTSAEAKIFIEGVLGKLDLKDAEAAVNEVSFTAAAAETASADGSDGSFKFTVTLAKGEVSDTTAEKTLVITKTAYNPLAENAAIALAKSAVEKAAFGPAAQSVAKTAAEAQTFIENKLAALALGGVDAVVNAGAFTAAVAETETEDGANGSFGFTVTLSKGKGTAVTTAAFTLTINYTEYDPNAENIAIAAAKDILENAVYGPALQSDFNNAAAALQFVVDIISNLDLDGVGAVVNEDSFTAAQQGTASNLSGINGSFGFTVTLSKGKGTTVTTVSLSLTITAIPMIAVPTGVKRVGTTLVWTGVSNASSYTVSVYEQGNPSNAIIDNQTVTGTSIPLASDIINTMDVGDYTYEVKANAVAGYVDSIASGTLNVNFWTWNFDGATALPAEITTPTASGTGTVTVGSFSAGNQLLIKTTGTSAGNATVNADLKIYIPAGSWVKYELDYSGTTLGNSSTSQNRFSLAVYSFTNATTVGSLISGSTSLYQAAWTGKKVFSFYTTANIYGLEFRGVIGNSGTGVNTTANARNGGNVWVDNIAITRSPLTANDSTTYVGKLDFGKGDENYFSTDEIMNGNVGDAQSSISTVNIDGEDWMEINGNGKKIFAATFKRALKKNQSVSFKINFNQVIPGAFGAWILPKDTGWNADNMKIIANADFPTTPAWDGEQEVKFVVPYDTNTLRIFVNYHQIYSSINLSTIRCYITDFEVYDIDPVLVYTYPMIVQSGANGEIYPINDGIAAGDNTNQRVEVTWPAANPSVVFSNWRLQTDIKDKANYRVSYKMAIGGYSGSAGIIVSIDNTTASGTISAADAAAGTIVDITFTATATNGNGNCYTTITPASGSLPAGFKVYIYQLSVEML